jgi:hypothetical protein
LHRQGLQRALEAGANEVAIFAAASESFSQRNINCSISESLKRFQEVVTAAKEANVAVRGYVSCAVGCPYQVLPCPFFGPILAMVACRRKTTMYHYQLECSATGMDAGILLSQLCGARKACLLGLPSVKVQQADFEGVHR